jgi:hypothetical protein
MVTISLAISLLYYVSNVKFDSLVNYTIFKKLEIVSFVFDKYYDELYTLKDFNLKVKELYS